MKKIISIMICIIIISSGLSVASEKETKKNDEWDKEILTSCHVKIGLPNAQETATLLSEKGFDVLRNTISETEFELIVTPYELDILKKLGYNPVILEKGRPFKDIQAERINSGLYVPPGYLDLCEIIEEMNATVDNYPDICKVYDITDKYDAPSTYEGRHIYVMKISDNVEEDEDEPNFLMVSCHHAREIVTPVIALYAIEQFTTQYGDDPDITNAVNDYEIWIAPVWNPDGYDYCYNVDNMWRKNRNPPDGVDLNRNYPFGWYSGCSGSTNPFSETYKGTEPASEAETQTMIAFTNDRHFVKVIDYHSYGREVLYGYACHSHPFSSFFQTEATLISSAAGYGGSIRPPSAEGEHYEWQIAVNGSYANLMETHTQFQPSYSSAESEAAQVFPATLFILERPISVSGHIIDSVTGDPIEAQISLEGISFPNDEEFNSEPKFGRYHQFLPAGSYELTFDADYYYSETKEVTVTEDSAENLDIELERYNEAPYAPIIDGPEDGIEGGLYELIIDGSDPEADDLYYFVNWGDHTTGEWIGPYPVGEQVTINHTYSSPGTFNIRAKAKDVYEDEGPWSDSITITIIENIGPSPPEIMGPNRGSPGIEYTFSFVSNDPESHQIYYYIKWGDGLYDEWIGPFNSGESVEVKHQWSTKDRYQIQAKAKDEYGSTSDWASFNINIPRNREMSKNIIQLFTDHLIKIFRLFFIY